MQGKGSIRFSDLMTDTIAVHGLLWAYNHYCKRNGMEAWEFFFWAGIPSGLTEKVWA